MTTTTTTPASDLIVILGSLVTNLNECVEAKRIPDAPADSTSAGLTLEQRQPRVGLPLTTSSVGPNPVDSLASKMSISQTGLNLIEIFEGLELNATWDIYGKVWTIGYGETFGIHQGMIWTAAEAEADLVNRLRDNYEPAIWNLGVSLNQNQFDALCSFVWNLGPGSMTWDVGRYLKQGNYRAAADAMLEYNRADGQVLPGLTRRREAERALFLTPVPAPPYNHHYERFPLAESIDNTIWNERAIVEEYDRLRVHGVLNRRKLKPIRNDLVALADRVWNVAHRTRVASWDSFYRGWRYQELIHRSQGKNVKS